MSTPRQLGKCIDLFNCDAAPVDTNFRWGRSARRVRTDGPRLLADHGPDQVGAALSMEACANGAHSWTLRRISKGSTSVSDYLGVGIGTGICTSASPTSGSFNGLSWDFEWRQKLEVIFATRPVDPSSWTAHPGGGSMGYPPWRKRLPCWRSRYEAGTVTFRAHAVFCSSVLQLWLALSLLCSMTSLRYDRCRE